MRGPIALLRGYLVMLRDGDIGPLAPPVDKVVRILDDQVAMMATLVEEMLETARLDDNQLELHREPIDLCDLTAEVLATTRPGTGPTHELHLDRPPDPVMVVVDRSRTRTVIANLVGNAIKFSPNGGEVRVTVGCDEKTASVSVKDSGLGIAASDMPRLFSRFGRIVTRENSHIGGTGLGLYLCRELARRQGGDVSLTSAAGAGTTALLTLPLNDTAAAAPADSPVNAANIPADD